MLFINFIGDIGAINAHDAFLGTPIPQTFQNRISPNGYFPSGIRSMSIFTPIFRYFH